MPFRLSLRAGAAMAIALFITVFVAITPSPAQSPAPPATKPAAPTQIAPTPDAGQSGDVFGENTSLKAQTIVYVKGSGTWDKAFETITGAFKKIDGYLDKEGIKASGLPMTIFTATDDTGFDYEAAIPIADTPKKNAPAMPGGGGMGGMDYRSPDATRGPRRRGPSSSQVAKPS